jgi:fructokinase
VDTGAVVCAADRNTALAVVTVAADGDRDFFFYRENCADADYGPEEVSLEVVRSSRFLHVGSLWLSAPRSAAAQRRAIEYARDAGIRISVDPNFRPAFWAEQAAMRDAGLEVLAAADVLKVSQDELFASPARSR